MGGALALLGGCTASTNHDDLFHSPSQTTPSDPPKDPPKDPPPQGCPSIILTCQPDERAYTNERACKSEETSCRRLGTPGCELLWCGKTEIQCDAYPACNADDEEVSTCPKGASCYSRTLCGTTILCQRPFGG